ncbi:MAG: serine/threonine protein kinase [Phycisphaerales bacterium]|nr:serine/threonine protein kinase [Phycisphaerales bacterium]
MAGSAAILRDGGTNGGTNGGKNGGLGGGASAGVPAANGHAGSSLGKQMPGRNGLLRVNGDDGIPLKKDPSDTNPLGGSRGPGNSPGTTPGTSPGDTARMGSKSGDPGATPPITVRDPGPAPTVQAIETALQEVAKGGTNVDTLVARMVVDAGLATNEEVEHCLALSRQNATEEQNQQSLMHILVNNRYATERQLARLKQQLEAERSGQQIAGYKFQGKLGAGAMATVHKAKQISLDRTVAIKILPRKFSNNPQFIERFYAEGRAAAALNHPNIVQAYDVGKSGEFHYFVMEFVDGRTVFDDIAKHKRYNEADAIDIIIQIAEALQHAHEKGLIHRDVKPKNLMLTKEGMAKLADMGLARAMNDKEMAEAEAGKAFGTPYYISPEQIRGEVNITPAADIYSLGATLYHMVTGNVPFDGKNPSAVMHKHLKAELVPPDHVNPKLSAGISEVIEMMMAKDPKARYKSCKDLLIDLRAVRKKENPPIAHKDVLPQEDIAALQALEASASSEIAEDKSVARRGPNPMLVWGLIISLVLSVGFNIVLVMTRT